MLSAIYQSTIQERQKLMDQHIRKVYVPMTETAFFILYSLRKPAHGYGIIRNVEEITSLGKEILDLEIARIKRLYNIVKGK